MEQSNYVQPKTFLGNISINTRVGFLVALGIIALVAGEVIVHVGHANLKPLAVKRDAFSRIEVNVLKADSGALMLRRREKDFILRQDTKYWDFYQKDHAEILERLKAVSENPVAGETTKHVDAIVAKLNEHKARFRKVVDMSVRLGLNEESGLKGSLRKAVHGVETKLREFQLDSLTVKMLMMRRHEKDFMLRGGDKYLGRISKRRTEFNPLLAAAPIPGQAKAEISSLMDAYQTEMKAYGEVATDLAAEVRRLSRIYTDMGPSSKALLNFAMDGQKASSARLREAEAMIDRIILIGTLLATAVLLCLSVLVMRSIVKPLTQITEATTRLAGGDRETTIPATENADGVGDIARALLVLKDNLDAADDLREEQKQTDVRAAEEKRRTMHAIADSLETSVGSVVDTVAAAAEEMENSARGMSVQADNTRSNAANAASAAIQASSNVQTVAAAAAELTSSIDEISRQIAQSTQISRETVETARQTGQEIDSLVTAAGRINEVVNLITDIAEQTNLLALNATIEAARAGDAGKGFAVVASEVKNLANQTAKATEEISSQISGIQSATNVSAEAIKRINDAVVRIAEVATSIASAVEEQNAATREIARNVEEAARGTDEVSSNITGVSDAATETGETSENILQAAGDLADQSIKLRSEVEKFANQVRTKA